MATQPATDRPTSDRYETVSRTTERTRTDALGELVATVSEQIGFPTVSGPVPDGDWFLENDSPTLKVWESRDGDQQVTIRSSGLAAGWHVHHDSPDGGTRQVTDRPLEREAAFAVAERLAADLGGVPVASRTGRASR